MEQDFEEIVKIVSGNIGVDPAGVLSKSRKQEYAIARIISRFFIEEMMPEANQFRVARYFRCDRSMIPYSKNKVNEMLDVRDPIYTDIYNKSIRSIIRYFALPHRNMAELERLCCNVPQLGTPYKEF